MDQVQQQLRHWLHFHRLRQAEPHIEHAFKVGFRLYLNEDTLKYNDRMGTTLDIVDPMTSAYRSFGRTWIEDNGSYRF